MNPFSNRTLVAIVAVALVTFVLGLVLAAFSGDLFGRLSADHNSYSWSLIGHHALTRFLERTGINVVVCRNSGLYRSGSAFPLLLLEPVRCSDATDPPPRPEAGSRLKTVLDNARETGATLVLAFPKYEVSPSKDEPRWISHCNLITSKKLEAFAHENDLFAYTPDGILTSRHASLHNVNGGPLGIERPAVEINVSAQILNAKAFTEPLLWCDEGVLIGRITRDDDPARIYLVSDPDLFNNDGLGRGDHAVLIHSLLAGELGVEGVIIDESLHGYSSGDSLMPRIMSFPMVLIVIHTLLAVSLLAWSASRRFGKPLEPPPALPPGKVLLLDNTARLLLSAGNHSAAVQRYLQVTMASAAGRFFLPEGTSRSSLMKQLKTLAEMRGLPFDLEDINREARNKNLGPAGALRLAHRIHSWRAALMETDQGPATAAGRHKKRKPSKKEYS